MSNEIRQIIQSVDESSERLVLATVVDVVGSAYRRPTARMLIFSDGHHLGSISGGCLERDLCRAAFDVTAGGPKLVSFDTRQDSTNFNPRYNLGCSGIIYVLLERITGDANCPVGLLRRVHETKRRLTVATVYQTDTNEFGEIGSRFTSVHELLFGPRTSPSLTDVWQQVGAGNRPTCCELHSSSGSTRLLIEKVAPPQPIWIFGAGDDAQPLAAMAWQLGWDVTVVDHRASLLVPERFQHARRVCDAWHNAHLSLEATEETVAVLLTHSFDADKLLLPPLLASSVSYVGVLGPKSRTGKVMRDLHASGQLPNVQSLDRLHTPVGLDIGARSSAEIAISILGELIATSNARSGGLLQQRDGPIHEPVRHVLVEVGAQLSTRAIRS